MFSLHSFVIWFTGGSLNIVIYTGIILALGMLSRWCNCSPRKHRTTSEWTGEDLKRRFKTELKEVVSPIWSGTVPLIAIIPGFNVCGWFFLKIFKPIVFTLIIALLVSYFLSNLHSKILEYLLKMDILKIKLDYGLNIYEKKSFGRLGTIM